mgnify:CR=1 FL=1
MDRKKDPNVIITVRDLEQIYHKTLDLHLNVDQNRLKMNDSQFKTYCYTMAVSEWLRHKDLLKIILD